MKNKPNKNNHLKISLGSIIKRLPVHRSLNASQNALIEFATIWGQWSKINIAPEFSSSISLNSFQNGVLYIGCTTPIAASQLKHLQVNLLNSFHNAGFNEIKQIKITIDHNHLQDEETNTDSARSNKQPTNYKPLDIEAINTIKNAQNSVKSEKLSHSLERLATTLAKTHRITDNENNT